jgi:predicted ATPase/DNA-binding NarL/FixJ family response regulator
MPIERDSHRGRVRTSRRASAHKDPATVIGPGSPLPEGSNLPTALTTFIGRARETAEVARLLDTARLLTLTGTGGAGKTRLALRVAELNLDAYRDGVWLVELAPVATADLVAASVAMALRLRETPGRDPVTVLADWLHPRQLLVVLDNCEHLIGACASLVDRLLRACPTLKVLATSRAPLGVPGEVTWRVPALSLPEASTRDAVLASEAGRLFVERAAASQADFDVSHTNAASVAEVCRRLDGIPLAIELAAARLRLLTVDEIAARLDDRFRLLTTGSRTSMPRQQTLRAAIEWSYDLLADAEQTLFGRLAVFVGGFSLDAAENVCGATLDQLGALVDRSLVQPESTDVGTRYRLLETLRHFADEQLHAAQGIELLRDRHVAWYLAFAERAAPRILGPEQSLWLNRLEQEHDNLRAALQWSVERDDAMALTRLGIALWEFWYIRGHLSEGRGWLDHAAARRAEIPVDAAGKLLRVAGNLAGYSRDHERAMALTSAALDLSRQAHDDLSVAACLFNMAGTHAERGDYGAAERLFDEAIPLMHATGDYYGEALALLELGYLAAYKAHYARAEDLLERGIKRFTELGDGRRTARATMRLGVVAILRGDTARGEALCRRGLEGFRVIDFLPGIADCLEALACAAALRGYGRRAAYLYGAAKALQQRIGQALSVAPADLMLRERSLRALARHLDPPAEAAARAAGHAAPLADVLSEALLPAEIEGVVNVDAIGEPLTQREREVARLIARGLTDRQIAEKLVVSPRTTHAHVRNILGKLGFISRVQIATWAVESDLAGRAEK